jgi:hypothetical protein
VHAVAHALRATVTLTQIHEKPQKQICSISQETEEALDAGSLAVLAESHDRPTKEAYVFPSQVLSCGRMEAKNIC